MSRGRRIILSIILAIMILVGVALIFVTRLDPATQTYDTQKTVCRFQYAIQLNPLQSKSNNCAVLQNDWLALAVKSNLNISLSIALIKVGGGQILLFNNTSTNLNATFPIVFNGAIVSTLTNGASNVSRVNGSLSVMAVALANTSSLNTNYPYRTLGEGLLAIGALGLFLVAWNPSTGALTTLPAIARKVETAN